MMMSTNGEFSRLPSHILHEIMVLKDEKMLF